MVLIYLGIGAILGLQWLTYFGTVKLANASVAVVCISTGAFMTSLLEPLLLAQKIKPRQVWFSILIIPAMLLIVYEMPERMLWGVFCGLFSALLAALFSVLNKKYITETSVGISVFWQFLGGLLTISLVMLALSCSGKDLRFRPLGSDWKYLIILAVVCTCLGYVLFLNGLKRVSAYSANMLVNLEPLYGVVFGAIILKDYSELNFQFYLGTLLIIIILFLPVLVRVRKT